MNATSAVPAYHTHPEFLELANVLAKLATTALSSGDREVATTALECLRCALASRFVPAPTSAPTSAPPVVSSTLSDYTYQRANYSHLAPALNSDRSLLSPGNTASRESARGTLDPQSLHDALAPLLSECQIRSLPGVTNPAGLLKALEGTTMSEVRAGVGVVLERLRHNQPVRSPIGLLATMARRGHLRSLAADTDMAERPSEEFQAAPQASGASSAEWLRSVRDIMRQ
jgi:hypothetical protein